MVTHTLTIPDWYPCSDNRLVGAHWSRVRARKRIDADMVAAYALRDRVPRATGRRRVGLRVEVPPSRGTPPDPTNLLKSCLDALVKAGLLVDDSGQWCEVLPPVVTAGEALVTRITLEDVG